MVQLLHLYRWHWAIHLGIGLWGVTWSCVYHTGFVVGLLVFLEAYGMESDMNIHKHSRPNVTLNGGLWMFMTCLVCPFIWWLRPENSKKTCVYIHVKIHQNQPQRSTGIGKPWSQEAPIDLATVKTHILHHFQPLPTQPKSEVGDMQSYARWLMGVACHVVLSLSLSLSLYHSVSLYEKPTKLVDEQSSKLPWTLKPLREPSKR